jgi:hypothetical protein
MQLDGRRIDRRKRRHQQRRSGLPTASPDLKRLGDRLVGTWEVTGGAQGRVTFEWMEGGFFLIQRVDLE